MPNPLDRSPAALPLHIQVADILRARIQTGTWRDGEWIPVDTLRGQIVVDSGDMMSRVTNGVIPATTHRVVNPPSTDDDKVRYSMPFFVHPYSECLLKPLDCCVTPDNPAKQPPITADAFLQQRLREIGLVK